MSLETGTYISDLNTSNPASGDAKSQGDDHLRLLKSTIKNTFPNVTGAVTPTQTELNRLVGSSSLVVDRAYAEYATNAALTTVVPYDDTIPQNTEGTQIISVAFTPKTTTNRLRLVFQGYVSSASSAVNVIAAIFSSASSSALRATIASTPAADQPTPITVTYEYVPATTSSLTFTVRIGPQSGTVRMNGNSSGRLLGGVSAATLVIEELTA